jgi:hypothetical protein
MIDVEKRKKKKLFFYDFNHKETLSATALVNEMQTGLSPARGIF